MSYPEIIENLDALRRRNISVAPWWASLGVPARVGWRLLRNPAAYGGTEAHAAGWLASLHTFMAALPVPRPVGRPRKA